VCCWFPREAIRWAWWWETFVGGCDFGRVLVGGTLAMDARCLITGARRMRWCAVEVEVVGLRMLQDLLWIDHDAIGFTCWCSVAVRPGL
jgi:hypothetical protein